MSRVGRTWGTHDADPSDHFHLSPIQGTRGHTNRTPGALLDGSRTRPYRPGSMYTTVLTIHSWVRWALVLLAFAALVRSGYAYVRRSGYALGDERLARGLFGTLNLQFVLGVLLYVFLSPTVRVALSDVGAAMGAAPLRFFVIEHPVAALLAIGIGHAGLKRARSATDERDKHRFVALGAGGCLLMILIAIPWPFLPYGRALVRL